MSAPHFAAVLAQAATTPLWPNANGVCSCRDGAACTKTGKHAASLWSEIKAGEHAPPGHWVNVALAGDYAILTGERSGLFVVEEDELDLLCKLGALPPTLTVRSARGRHYYFLWPGFHVLTCGSRLAPHVDIRGDGGFIVGPGSLHKTGVRYEIERDAPIAAAPTWLLDKLRALLEDKGEATGEESPARAKDDPTYAARFKQGERITDAEDPAKHVAGKGGAKTFFIYIQKLRVGLGLQDDDCRTLVARLNARLLPGQQWEDSYEVDHKLEEAATGKGTAIKPDAIWKECAWLHGFTPEGELVKEPEKLCNARPTGDKLNKTSLSALCFELSGGPYKKKDDPWVHSHTTTGELAPVICWDKFTSARVMRERAPIKADAKLNSAARRWTDGDTLRIKQWFEVNKNIQASEELVEQACTLVAQENEINTVGDWLDTLASAPGSIEQLADVLGLQSNIERKMLRNWLISACARAYQPGVFVKSALVLQSKQNAGKSTALERLCGPGLFGKLRGDLSDPKVVGEKLAGKWIVEIEEAHSLSKTDVNAMKGMLSETHDDYRGAYERHAVKRARTCVFAVTTNGEEILSDPTGNVRYWCARTGDTINLDRVSALRDGVWAEARDAYKAGEPWHFTGAEDQAAAAKQAASMRTIDPIEAPIAEYLEGRVFVTTQAVLEHLTLSMTAGRGGGLSGEVLERPKPKFEHLIKAGSGRLDHRIAKALAGLECEPTRWPSRGWTTPTARAADVRVSPKTATDTHGHSTDTRECQLENPKKSQCS